MKTRLLSFVFVFASCATMAQKNTSNGRQLATESTEQNRQAIGIKSEKLDQAKIGTFQLIIVDPNHQIALNDDFYRWIESQRLEDIDKTLVINEKISLFLPSSKAIKAALFSPLEVVKYVTQ